MAWATMGTLYVTHDIDAPRSRVWDIFTDYPGWPVWTSVDAISIVEAGRPTPNGLGCIREVLQGGMRIREEISVFEPPAKLGGRILSGVPLLRDYRSHLTFEEIDDGQRTRLTARATFELGVPLVGWALERMFRWSSTRQIQGMFRDLNAYIARLDR